MLILFRLIKLFTSAVVLYGCTTPKEIFYSYKVNTYTTGPVKQFIYSNNLISYGDYLFEFKDRENRNRIVDSHSDTTYIHYDTIGVYLLFRIDKLYYEFDTFTLKNEVVKIGRLTEKEFGFKFSPTVTNSYADFSFTPPKHIIINNINCFITEIVPSKKIEDDSIKQELILIKNTKFNSLYKMNGIKFTDNNYCIVGFHIYDLNKKQGLLQEIESMRPLTDKEKAICESMIKKSKSAIVDTIKGMPSR